MATTNLDSHDLTGADFGGLINEDVMQKIWDISKIPLPFTDMIGSGSSSHPRKEWTLDSLAAASTSNAFVDGADTNTQDDTAVGTRVSNFHQISVKVVQVSTRAQNTDNIGRANELAYQVMRRQQELKRDVEATSMFNQASLAGDSSTASKAGGLSAWLETNVSVGAGAGAVGGFNTTTGVVDARTAGTGRTLTETLIKDTVEDVYEQGGDPTILMTVPGLVRKISEYMFTSSARVGTLISDQGKSAEKATALGSVNVFVTDFGTLELIPNRLQPKYNTDTEADVFILDPKYLSMSYLHGYRTEPLAKTGLADKRQMAVDWTLCVNTEKAHGMISDVIIANAVTA